MSENFLAERAANFSVGAEIQTLKPLAVAYLAINSSNFDFPIMKVKHVNIK